MTGWSRATGRDGADAVRTAAGHGGRLAAAMAAYPDAPTPWLDLSTGINPDPWQGPRASLEALARLPDPTEIAELEVVAARVFGADPARVVATAGAEAGLRLAPRRLRLGDVDIVSPTYGGHAAAWRAGGAQVREIAAKDASGSTATGLVLVNPNNPDGGAWPRETLAALVAGRAARGAWTLVDESFGETDPGLSIADVASDRLIVFRSFGKFYGLAGVRLGFVIAPPDLAAELRAEQGDWPVGADAVAMGVEAYADTAWRDRTRAALARRAAALDELLARHGLTVVGGTTLFRLASVADAAGLFDRLCRAGVLTRPFLARPDWLRFGLPREADLPRLDRALAEAKS